jgi:hypothetical protein
MTLEQRVRRIEKMLGLLEMNKKLINDEALRSFLSGNSRPLERLLTERRLQDNISKELCQVKNNNNIKIT